MKDLPERDTTKPTEQQGMFRKFEVRRIDGSDRPSGKHHGCRYFVLDLDHDQHAAAAMAAYAQAARETHPTLSSELAAQYPPSSPTWLNHDAAISDPIFHEARGIMGTENYGQEEALRMAILHVISAYSGSLERGHAQPPKGGDGIEGGCGMAEPIDEQKAEGRRKSLIAEENAKKVLKSGDRLRVTKCPGTKRWITFERWDGHWIVSKSGIDDFSPMHVDRLNGEPVDFTIQQSEAGGCK